MCPDGSFLSLSFKLAFEQHHKSNIKHLYYLADDKEYKAIGYAQEFNIRSNRIRDYQKKNKVKGGLINIVLKLLNLKVVALGNGLLTNISNFSACGCQKRDHGPHHAPMSIILRNFLSATCFNSMS